MGFRDKAKEHKEDLLQRMEESAASKDEKTNQFGSIILKENLPTSYTYNGKVYEKKWSMWNPKAGEHCFDIIPFFAGSQHPKTPQGKKDYRVDLWVYKDVGPLREQFVSPQSNFKIVDPIAEFMLNNKLSKAEWNKKRAKRRVIYLVWVHDSKEEEDKGVQIYDEAHFFMEQKLIDAATMPFGGGFINFAHEDVGKRIYFKREEKGTYEDAAGKSQKAFEYSSHKFIERPAAIPDFILEQSIPLDEYIHMHPTYEEIKAAAFPESYQGKQESISVQSTSTPVQTTHSLPVESSKKIEYVCPQNGTFGVSIGTIPECSTCPIFDPCDDQKVLLTNSKPPIMETKQEPPVQTAPVQPVQTVQSTPEPVTQQQEPPVEQQTQTTKRPIKMMRRM